MALIARPGGLVIVRSRDSRFEGAALRDCTLAQIRQMLLRRLHATGWNDTYPVLVRVWDKNVICSPSAQIWVRHVSQGQPAVEGVFEQRVQNPATKFSGAVPADLSRNILGKLNSEAIQIARVLQHWGYFGRCSVDAVVCKGISPENTIHWIECNGRWEGVSSQTAARHFAPEHSNHPLSITQERWSDVHPHTKPLLHRMKDLLFNHNSQTEGLIAMSPPDTPQGTLPNLCAVARTQTIANRHLDEAMGRPVQSGDA